MDAMDALAGFFCLGMFCAVLLLFVIKAAGWNE